MQRIPGAIASAAFFWILGGFALTGELADVTGRRARAFHFFVDTVLVGALGQTGAAALFFFLGIVVPYAILRQREPR
jgi:hypothetical protein